MVFVWILLGLVVGVVGGIVLMRFRPMFGLKNVESKVNSIIKEAETKANDIKHSAPPVEIVFLLGMERCRTSFYKHRKSSCCR